MNWCQSYVTLVRKNMYHFRITGNWISNSFNYRFFHFSFLQFPGNHILPKFWSNTCVTKCQLFKSFQVSIHMLCTRSVQSAWGTHAYWDTIPQYYICSKSSSFLVFFSLKPTRQSVNMLKKYDKEAWQQTIFYLCFFSVFMNTIW
jgi:hypothetical protein